MKKKVILVIFCLLGLLVLGSFLIRFTRGGVPSQKPPEISYIWGRFLKYKDIGTDKEGFACAETLADFKQVVAQNKRKFIYVSDSAAKDAEKEDFLTNEKLWHDNPEYFSFWPADNGKMLRCGYFTSTYIIESLKRGEAYELGYFKKAITKDSFNSLVDFLTKAKIAPKVPTEGFNFTLKNRSSKIEESDEAITRVDEVSYSLQDDTSLSLPSNAKETCVYSLSKADGKVTVLLKEGVPYYPFP